MDKLGSDVEDDDDDSGINDDIESLAIKLVLGLDMDAIDEGKGITHPVKINAKKGIPSPMNRKPFSLFI
jgi:hypothetical protein